jgi:hypothetical protein
LECVVVITKGWRGRKGKMEDSRRLDNEYIETGIICSVVLEHYGTVYSNLVYIL